MWANVQAIMSHFDLDITFQFDIADADGRARLLWRSDHIAGFFALHAN